MSATRAALFGWKEFNADPSYLDIFKPRAPAGRAFMLSNGCLLLAVADVSVNGERLEGKDLTPLIEVPFDIGYAEGKDPSLRAHSIFWRRWSVIDWPGIWRSDSLRLYYFLAAQ